MFDGRHWPAGFDFPACGPCNDITRKDELIVAMLSRLYPDGKTEQQEREMQNAMRGVDRAFPGLLAAMKPTIRQVRNAEKVHGVHRAPETSAAEAPFLNVDLPVIHESVRRFGRKLALALYYKHTGAVLAPMGGVSVRWYSNIQIFDDEIPHELADLLADFPELRRSGKDLTDQFFCRIGMADTRSAGAFLAFFRESFGIVGFFCQDASLLDGLPVGAVEPPFEHAQRP